MQCTINLTILGVNNPSMSFSASAMMCNHRLYLVPNHLHPSTIEVPAPWAVSPHPRSPKARVKSDPFSASMDGSQKRNHTIRGL